MNFAKNQCWLGLRLVAELQEDGSVIFPDDVTVVELKEAIKLMFQEAEMNRLRRTGKEIS